MRVVQDKRESTEFTKNIDDFVIFSVFVTDVADDAEVGWGKNFDCLGDNAVAVWVDFLRTNQKDIFV